MILKLKLVKKKRLVPSKILSEVKEKFTFWLSFSGRLDRNTSPTHSKSLSPKKW